MSTEISTPTRAVNPPGRTSSPAATAGIVIGWLLVNGLFLLKNGIVTTGEAAKYIWQAQVLTGTHHFETPNFVFYSVIILLISACLKFHLSFAWIVAIQGGFALAATLYFHKTALQLLRSPGAALIATSLLILSFPYQAFNTFLQTESLFQSLSLLLVCRLIRQTAWSGRFIITLIFGLIFLSLLRPTGLLYWPLAGIYVFGFVLAKKSTATKLITASVAALVLVYVIDLAMNSGGELDFTRPFRQEHIICGVPTLLTPTTITPAVSSGNQLSALITWLYHHPGRFFRLAGLKTLSFWGMYRSYYSLPHNLYLIAYFCPISILALMAIPSWRRNGLLPFFYLATPVLITWLTVVFTCDDWSNRFFLSISPFLILLGARIYARKPQSSR
ncbi:hypothetical protein [Puia dinghuensis]|uniref:Uncharacterized protein n=1 Tax=Puia dinghuensis TaxID=1792502 RepID=A0A8J2XT88_9BACT|nr:hypothetical protein [Puia dinghuensis]GGB15369.1 hypothetical protein GCM10011511_43910 [Puia dinghuensis]